MKFFVQLALLLPVWTASAGTIDLERGERVSFTANSALQVRCDRSRDRRDLPPLGDPTPALLEAAELCYTVCMGTPDALKAIMSARWMSMEGVRLCARLKAYNDGSMMKRCFQALRDRWLEPQDVQNCQVPTQGPGDWLACIERIGRLIP